MKIVFLTHVFKKKIDRYYSLVKVNENVYMKKMRFFYYLLHSKNEFEKFLLVFEKIAKNCFSCVAYFPSNSSVCRNISSYWIIKMHSQSCSKFNQLFEFFTEKAIALAVFKWELFLWYLLFLRKSAAINSILHVIKCTMSEKRAIVWPTTCKKPHFKIRNSFWEKRKKHFWSCCREPTNNRTLA